MSEIKHRIHLAENFFSVLSIDPLFIYFSMSVHRPYPGIIVM